MEREYGVEVDNVNYGARMLGFEFYLFHLAGMTLGNLLLCMFFFFFSAVKIIGTILVASLYNYCGGK